MPKTSSPLRRIGSSARAMRRAADRALTANQRTAAHYGHTWMDAEAADAYVDGSDRYAEDLYLEARDAHPHINARNDAEDAAYNRCPRCCETHPFLCPACRLDRDGARRDRVARARRHLEATRRDAAETAEYKRYAF